MKGAFTRRVLAYLLDKRLRANLRATGFPDRFNALDGLSSESVPSSNRLGSSGSGNGRVGQMHRVTASRTKCSLRMDQCRAQLRICGALPVPAPLG